MKAEKNKTPRWNPRVLYFKKEGMSIFRCLAMEKNDEKRKIKKYSKVHK